MIFPRRTYSTLWLILVILSYPLLSYTHNSDEDLQSLYARVDSLNHLAKEEHQNVEFSLFLAKEAYSLAKEGDYLKGIADSDYVKGLIYANIDFAQSLHHYLTALKHYERENNKVGEALVLMKIGVLYDENRNFGKALDYLQRALVRAEAVKDDLNFGELLYNVGLVYGHLGRHDEALDFLYQAKRRSSLMHNSRSLAWVNMNISKIYQRQGKAEEALIAAYEGVELAKEYEMSECLSELYKSLGRIYLDKGRIDMAIEYTEEARQLALKTSSNTLLLEVTKKLADLYEKKGDLKRAVSYYQSFAELKDQVYSSEQNELMAQLQMAYELEKKERENQILKEQSRIQAQEIKHSSLTVLGIVVLLCIVLVLAYVAYRSYLREKAQNEILTDQNATIMEQREILAKRKQTLEKVIRDKDNILDIVSHDLKAPFNRINGLINLIRLGGDLSDNQAESLQLIEKTADDGKEIISDLLDSQLTIGGFTKLNLQELDVCQLIGEIVHNYNSIARRKDVIVHMSMPFGLKVKTDPTLLTRIIDNLLSNALKFSPPKKDVFVEAKEKGDHFQIRIKDNGPGFSEEDKKKLYKRFQKLSAQPTGNENSTGLGLSIVKSLTDRLRGSIELVSEQGGGSEFILEFQKHIRSEKKEKISKPMESQSS